MDANQYEVNNVIDGDRHTAPIPGNIVADRLGDYYRVIVNEDGTTTLVWAIAHPDEGIYPHN